METKDFERVTLRIPPTVHRWLVRRREAKPHMSMNAIIIEAVLAQMDRESESHVIPMERD